MDNMLAPLQAELRDISFRLDVLEKRSGITIDAMPPQRIADPAEVENGRESREDRAERRHQELVALARQLAELLWQQRYAELNEKQAAPVRRLQ